MKIPIAMSKGLRYTFLSKLFVVSVSDPDPEFPPDDPTTPGFVDLAKSIETGESIHLAPGLDFFCASHVKSIVLSIPTKLRFPTYQYPGCTESK